MLIGRKHATHVQRMESSVDVRRLRGRAAIEDAHSGVTLEVEPRIDNRIASLYGADREEATEIHANYHAERIFLSLVRRCVENGMKKGAIAERLKNLNLVELASQVARGRLVEAAAVEILFRMVAQMERSGAVEDRYINFYA